MSPGGYRCMARSTPTTGAISRPKRRALDTSSIMCSAHLPSLRFRIEAVERSTGQRSRRGYWLRNGPITYVTGTDHREVARPKGFEPLTFAFGELCTILQGSYFQGN